MELPPEEEEALLALQQVTGISRRHLLGPVGAGGPGQESRVKVLSLSYCKSLVELPIEIKIFTETEELLLTDCSRLTHLPPWIGQLKNLKRLCLYGCITLSHIPHEIGNLNNLTELVLCHCRNLFELPQSIGLLDQMQVLNLNGCHNLRAIPPLGRMKKLAVLNLGKNLNLSELPDGMWSLPKLRELSLRCCTQLEQLPVEIGRLEELERINLTSCSGLKELPIELLSLPNISNMNLGECKRLSLTPEEIEKHCYSLRYIVPPPCRENPHHLNVFYHYIALNKAGRHLLRTHDVPDALWTRVLGRISSNREVLYFFLREHSNICHNVAKA